MSKKVYVILMVLAVLSLLTTQCAPAATPTPAAKVYKLAAIFPGVITDADYNTLAYVGVNELAKETGIKTAYSENVAVPDVERVMREYVDQGFNIIWTHGGQFVTQTATLAKTFPDRIFIAEGDAPIADSPENLWFIDRNFHVGYYAIGALATKATKNGKIAYLGGQTLAFSYAEVHAIEQAIAETGAKVDFKKVWAGDFNDPSKARQLADALIAEGYDVIMGSLNLGMFGVFEAVKASSKPVLVTAKYTDKTSFAPKNYLTSLIYDFAGPLKEIYKNIQAGKKGGYYPLGFNTGVLIQTPLLNTTAEVSKAMEPIIADLKSGKITVKKDTSEVK